MAYYECTGAISTGDYALYISNLGGGRGVTTDSSYGSFSVTLNTSNYSKMKIGSTYSNGGSVSFSHAANTTYDITDNDTITLSGSHGSGGLGTSYGYNDIYFYY